jgi:hypothetical protein
MQGQRRLRAPLPPAAHSQAPTIIAFLPCAAGSTRPNGLHTPPFHTTPSASHRPPRTLPPGCPILASRVRPPRTLRGPSGAPFWRAASADPLSTVTPAKARTAASSLSFSLAALSAALAAAAASRSCCLRSFAASFSFCRAGARGGGGGGRFGGLLAPEGRGARGQAG